MIWPDIQTIVFLSSRSCTLTSIFLPYPLTSPLLHHTLKSKIHWVSSTSSSSSCSTRYLLSALLSVPTSPRWSSPQTPSFLFFSLAPNLTNSLHSSSPWYSGSKVISFLLIELLASSLSLQPQYSSCSLLLILQFFYSAIVFISLFIKLSGSLWHIQPMLHSSLSLLFFFHTEEYLNLSFALE